MKPRPPIPEGPYLIVGLARSGVAAARALHARGEQVVGVDGATPDAAARTLAEDGIEVHLGTDGRELLGGVRVLLKSPGVPAQAPVVTAARAAGMTVIGELELAWRLLPNEFVAVTGTNGKTTTVELIGHIHREAGLPVAVAGNVGVALSGLVGQVDPDATIVCEASSFQLEDTLAFAPEAAVLLNITPDHLDRHGTMDAYRHAKLQAFARQGAGDVAVLPLEYEGAAVSPDVRLVRFGEESPADCALRDGRIWWEREPLLDLAELRLRGSHNARNALAAAAVCLARGIDADAVRGGLRSFAGVAHRLEEVARREGVLYVNDSKATNVASTLVALQAFAPGRIHLILGGQGKGQDFAALRDPIAVACRAVYLIGEDAPLIARALKGSGVSARESHNLEGAVAAASLAATSGETVLLSPACASFDQFADFEARGERFRELVRGL
ncbi:MAG TPA: UDP-N-acetylmuramoyl-L-alanine--D-glutamate ligase [Solirubrobacteraceae bacterium]